MDESETWNARLQDAIKAQEKRKKVNDLFASGAQARSLLQETCDLAYGDGIGKVTIKVYIPEYKGDGPYEFTL